MADENKLATFKWFIDTYTCGTLDSGISETIFNYPYYTKSDKVINYQDFVSPENYKSSASIANKTNFEDSNGNTKCILQSHIKELLNTNYKYKVGFQKNTLDSGEHNGKECLYIKMIDIANIDAPPDDKIKIKIIIYENETDGNAHTVDIPIATSGKDYVYIIVSNIYRVEIVGVSVFRPSEVSMHIVQPQIEYHYTYNLVGYISAAKNTDDGNFNGSKITKGGVIETFVSNGGGNPDSGGGSGGSGDSTTQKDLVIQEDWVNLDKAVNSNGAKICWAAVDYIINENTILIHNYADVFETKVYALLYDSAKIIEQIYSIDPNYNNSEYIFVAFEELYNTVRNKNDINELQNYEYFSELPDEIHELQLTSFIDYGDNLIKHDKNE